MHRSVRQGISKSDNGYIGQTGSRLVIQGIYMSDRGQVGQTDSELVTQTDRWYSGQTGCK